MQCPHDGSVLTMTERKGVEIDYCPQCRGVWLDRGELDKIVDRSMEAEIAAESHGPGAGAGADRPAYQAVPDRDPRGYDDRRYDDRRDDDRRYDDRRYDDRRYDDRRYDNRRDDGRRPQDGRRRKKESWLGDLFDF